MLILSNLLSLVIQIAGPQPPLALIIDDKRDNKTSNYNYDIKLKKRVTFMALTIEERTDSFKKHVFLIGGTVYTRLLLDNFIDYWTEPNRSKAPKMRYELQKTWDTKRRLNTWASRTRDYTVYLTDSQKTIQSKKRDFAISLEKHLDTYSREILNAFYLYWIQPENKPNPERLRWELEHFWDLASRLQAWSSRPHNQQPINKPTYSHR